MHDLSALAPIETPRLQLAPLTGGDAAALWRLTDDPEIVRRIHFLKSPFTLEDAEALISRNESAGERMLAIRRRDGGELLGTIGAHLRGESEVEIGYWLASAVHGQGFATEALAGVIGALKRSLPGRRIVAECDPQNVASWRVLAKCGFQPTGEPGLRPGRRLLAVADPRR